MEKEKQLKDVDKLLEIGNLITRQETEFGKLKVSNVAKQAKSTYDAAISFIRKHESDEMKDASNKQIHLLGAIEEQLVELRKSINLEEYDTAIRRISKLATKANDTEGSKEAKKFIADLSKTIASESKMSKATRAKSAIAGKLGSADLSLKSIFDIKPLKDPTIWKPDSAIGILMTLLDTRSKQESRKQAEDIEDQIESKEKSLDPFRGKKTRKIKEDKKTKTTKEAAQPTESAETPKATAVQSPDAPKTGEMFTDIRGNKYEKWATGWRNLETGRIERKEVQERIGREYKERMATFGGKETRDVPKVTRRDRPSREEAAKPVAQQTFKFPDKIAKLTIDSLIVKKIELPEGAFKQEANQAQEQEAGDIDRRARRTRTRTGRNPSRLGRAGRAGRLAGLGSFALGAAPMVALGGATLAADYAMEHAEEMTAEGSGLDIAQKAVGGKGLKPEATMSNVELMEKETSTGWWEFGGKEKRIKKIKSQIAQGVEFSADEAQVIKKNLDFTVPEENIKTNVKPVESAVNQTAADIRTTTNRIEQAETKQQSAPIVINQPAAPNNAPEPPVIIPIKGSVRSNESSFNRFQDRNFVR